MGVISRGRNHEDLQLSLSGADVDQFPVLVHLRLTGRLGQNSPSILLHLLHSSVHQQDGPPGSSPFTCFAGGLVGPVARLEGQGHRPDLPPS